MQAEALSGGLTRAPQQSADAFRAALTALSRPGRIEEISGGHAPAPVSPAAATLLLVLCDPETPIFLAGAHDTPVVRDWITFHIGAPLTGPDRAAFSLGTWEALRPVQGLPIGTPEYPDRSCTMIVEMQALASEGARLTGPGIQTDAYLNLPELAAFQSNHALFPQGHDYFLTSGTQIAGLPRSTQVEAD